MLIVSLLGRIYNRELNKWYILNCILSSSVYSLSCHIFLCNVMEERAHFGYFPHKSKRNMLTQSDNINNFNRIYKIYLPWLYTPRKIPESMHICNSKYNITCVHSYHMLVFKIPYQKLLYNYILKVISWFIYWNRPSY